MPIREPGKYPKILPAFVRPFNDELFSSWLFRLSASHQTKAHTFYKYLFPKTNFWNRDVDKSISTEIIHSLSNYTDTCFNKIYECTLKSYGGILFEQISHQTSCQWILPLGIYHRTWKRKGLLYCPACLKRDGNNPYFRKRWRLSLTVVCLECEIYMHDCCFNCMAPIIFFRLEVGKKNQTLQNGLNICYNCSTDLTLAPLKLANKEILETQNIIFNIAHNGWTKSAFYPIQFFLVFKTIINIFVGKRNVYRKLQAAVAKELSFPDIDLQGGFENRFDTLNVDDRARALVMALWILDDFPNRFISIIKPLKIYSSDLLRDMTYIPFWYHSVIQSNFYVSNANRRLI